MEDPADVERARTFWAEEDVDHVFEGVFLYLDHLKTVLRTHTASDKEYVQAYRLLESLGCSSPASPQAQDPEQDLERDPKLDQNQDPEQDLDQDPDSSVVQVVIGSAELLPVSPPPTAQPAFNGCPAAPPAAQEELLPPLTPVQLQYQLHVCCRACLSGLPSMPQSTPLFWAQNPLKVPLLCGFKRLSAVPLMSPSRGGGALRNEEEEVQEDVSDWDVIYKTPCGLSLRNYDDVMRFLLATASYDVLQVDFFTFNPSVRLDPPPPVGPWRPEQDLSRGAEPTPVELCVGEGGARPADFRYRKDRWPHGCFLSRSPALFDACCDCSDGCSDPQRCACVAMTTGGHHYSHHRLQEPVLSGVYECGPWCGCDRARCQNRVVQRGLRLRLQVFQTDSRGWSVRCRDDLDRGTFVCIYAGVVLRRVPSPSELPPPKLTRADLPSDDEVEVVTEWLAPPVLEGRSNLLETPPPMSPATSPPLHVPVIQRPEGAGATDRDTVLTAGDQPQLEKVAMTTTAGPGMNGEKSLKRAVPADDVCFIDASREGNVSRFFNHSCQPNLFIQNVFIDSHDPAFPVVAFFTNRVVKAGVELTWNYSADVWDSPHTQEVPCLCASDGCRGQFVIEENLCDLCEVEGQTAAEAQ